MSTRDIESFRKTMDIFNEASFSSIVSGIKDEVGAALGSDRAKGNLDRKALAKTFRVEFDKFLGRTNQDSSPKVLLSYLTDVVGFTEENATQILNSVGISDITESLMEAMNSDILNNVFLKSAEVAFKMGVVPGISNSKSTSQPRKKKSKSEPSEPASQATQASDQSEPTVKSTNPEEKVIKVQRLLDEVGRQGLDAEDIRNLSFAASKKSFEQIMSEKSIENKNQLAALGYAALKILSKKH